MPCATFINTADDDIDEHFFDDCIGASQLRVRVFSSDHVLEEDVAAMEIGLSPEWPNFDYLGVEHGSNRRTFWGTTTFFTTTDGRDACMQQAAPGGIVFGSGDAGTAIVAPANSGDDEYRINCGGKSLPHRRIVVYRDLQSLP